MSAEETPICAKCAATLNGAPPACLPEGRQSHRSSPKAQNSAGMTWQRNCNRVRFVNEDEILIHPFRIDGTLKHQQVFHANDAMLHPGLEVKLSARREDFDRKRLLVGWTPKDKTRAYADFESLVLLLVNLERKISPFAHDEIFLHAWMFVKCDDNTAPAGANHAIVRVLDAIK